MVLAVAVGKWPIGFLTVLFPRATPGTRPMRSPPRYPLQKSLELAKVFLNGGLALLLHPVIQGHHPPPHLGENCSAASLAPALGHHHRRPKSSIQRLHVLPGGHVSHAHPPRRRPQTAGLPDQFQQLNPPRPQSRVPAAHHAQPRQHRRRRSHALFLPHNARNQRRPKLRAKPGPFPALSLSAFLLALYLTEYIGSVVISGSSVMV